MADRFNKDERPRGTLGDHLLYYRRKNGYTQEQIAEILCMNRTTYTKYETGITEPNIAMLKKIAEVFEVDVNSLLDDGDPLEMDLNDPGIDPVQLKYLKKVYYMLDDSDREKLLKYAAELEKEQLDALPDFDSQGE